MSSAIKGVTKVTNTRTGQTGTFIARWYNETAGQWIVNIKVSGMMASWNEGEAE